MLPILWKNGLQTVSGAKFEGQRLIFIERLRWISLWNFNARVKKYWIFWPFFHGRFKGHEGRHCNEHKKLAYLSKLDTRGFSLRKMSVFENCVERGSSSIFFFALTVEVVIFDQMAILSRFRRFLYPVSCRKCDEKSNFWSFTSPK